MPLEPFKCVVDELGRRVAPPPPQHHRPPGLMPPRLSAPELASVRVLSERVAGDRYAVALTVADATGERYYIVRELVQDLTQDDGWRRYSGCEGKDRVIPGKPDPYASFYAYAGDGHFFAAGRVQSASTRPTRIRIRWDDGYAVEDEIQNDVALLFGNRDALEPATVEFLDPSGLVIGPHVTFVDEP